MGLQLEQQLALEASASAQQQEVESPFFEGHSCCEIDAGDVVGVCDAGGENGPGSRGWLCYVHALGGDPGVEIENIRRWLGFLLAESNLSL